MEKHKPRTRRRHDQELKQQVLEECAAAGASVANVAMGHGLNANLVHKWRRQARPSVVSSGQAFVPVALAAAVSEAQSIQLELHRGALCVRVNWPLASAAASAAWLREILR